MAIAGALLAGMAVAGTGSGTGGEAEAPASAGSATLHVPSPDWRDQVVYMVMLDRFDDGDPGNNDQGVHEFDPADGAKFSGGDLAGLTRRLDYIAGLGATSVWITPPVANQWWNPRRSYGGYHGYWAIDFKAVDAHFGTLDDYRALSRSLHGAGMYLIQDVVVNHVANYFGYPPGPPPIDPSRNVRIDADSAGLKAPTQWPFSLNDPRDPVQRAAGVYHWTPDIVDFSDREQQLNWQLAGLDDLNTENPLVRTALRDAYGYWIREVGVDGFRVDTAFYVRPEYFTDFLHAEAPDAPGIARVAAGTGRDDFHVFGEGFGFDKPFEDAMARRIDSYMRDPDGTTLLPGMINFPLHGTLGDVFARGHPPAELAHRIETTMRLHQRPHLMPTFIDNHDVDRFLASGSEPALRQALLAMLTLPGIPTIYYGTEQGFTSMRGSMFAAGHGSGGGDHFDTDAPLYRYLQRAIALRRGHRLFSRGNPTLLAANTAAAGALAYRMEHEGDAALVVFNTGTGETLLDNLDTGLASGTRLQGLFAIDGEPGDMIVDDAGRLSLVLPPRAGFVWGVGEPTRGRAARAEMITLEVDATTLASAEPGTIARVRGDFRVHGTARGAKRLQVVVDGDLGAANAVEVDADGRWQARVDIRDMVAPAIVHNVVAWDPERGVASGRYGFSVDREWTLLREVVDATGDDTGPGGRYQYPDDAGWREHRQGDLRGVRIWSSGGALKLQMRMGDVTTLWDPANGYDHVAFTAFVELPDRTGGAAVMPQQNATLPDGMRWHVRLRAHGWSNALFGDEGASVASEGTPIAAAASSEVDREAGTITFTIPARALGRPDTLSGARVYVTTWDYDGGYRPLTAQAQAGSFGGGDGTRDPLVLDDTGVIRLPEAP